MIYWTNSAPVLVQDGEYTELTLKGDNEIGPFYSMSSLNLSGGRAADRWATLTP